MAPAPPLSRSWAALPAPPALPVPTSWTKSLGGPFSVDEDEIPTTQEEMADPNHNTQPEKYLGLKQADVLALEAFMATEGTPEEKLKSFTRALQGRRGRAVRRSYACGEPLRTVWGGASGGTAPTARRTFRSLARNAPDQ